MAQIKKLLNDAEAKAQNKTRGSCFGGYEYECGYDECESLWLPVVRQLIGMVEAPQKAFVDQ